MKTPNGIDAHIVSMANRTDFLPFLFGADYVLSETCMYIYAKKYIKNYQGEYWNFFSLPDGGFMAPNVERVVVCNPDNYFEKEMSGEAAGLFITSLVLNHRSWLHSRHDQEELCELFCLRHESVMNYISYHEERRTIFTALD